MKKHCYCCGKEVKFLDNMDLANGKICTDCYEKVHKIDDSISWRNTFNYNGEYIKQLIELNEGIITQITAEPHLETIENKQEVDIKKEDNTQEAAKPKIKPMVEKLKKTRKTLWEKIKKSKKIVIWVFVIVALIIGTLIPVNNYFSTKKSVTRLAESYLRSTILHYDHLDNVSLALQAIDDYEKQYSSSYNMYNYLPKELRAENVCEQRRLKIENDLYDIYVTLRKKYSNIDVTAEDYNELNKLSNCINAILTEFPDGLRYLDANENVAVFKVTDELKSYQDSLSVMLNKSKKLKQQKAIVGTWTKATGVSYTFEENGHMSVSLSQNYDSSVGTTMDGREVLDLLSEIERWSRIIRGGRWEYIGENEGYPTYSLYYQSSNHICLIKDRELRIALSSGLGGVSILTR